MEVMYAMEDEFSLQKAIMWWKSNACDGRRICAVEGEYMS